MSQQAAQIIQGLKENHSDTFRYLYRTFGGMIIGYIKKNGGSDQDAKEMVQIVLLELWTAVQEGRYQEEGKLDRYIYMLSSNTWRDELRRRQVRRTDTLDLNRHVPVDDAEQSIAAAIVKDARLEAIQHCLQQLESPCDDIIKLYHLQEIRLQEIAVQMGYDYNNLRKRIFDCRKKLKKLVDNFLQQQSTTQSMY